LFAGSVERATDDADGCCVYYWEAGGVRKKKNKKGCFHSPFFSPFDPG